MNKILSLHNAGFSQRAIAKKLRIGKTTVARAIQKSKNTFDVDELAKALALVARYQSANLSSVTFVLHGHPVSTPKPTSDHVEHFINVVLPSTISFP